MPLRAPDHKTEHGWEIVNDEGEVVEHAPSRDQARKLARSMELLRQMNSDNGTQPDAEPNRTTVEASPILKQTPEEVTGTVVDERSPEEVAAWEANRVHANIRACVVRAAEATFDLSRWLYTFQQERMYEALGYDSFNAYVSDPDTEVGVRWANELVAIYKQLVVDRGVPLEELKQLQVSKVSAVLPAVRREQVEWEEAKADVEALSKRDLETKYSGSLTRTPGRPDTDTKVRTEEEPTIAECPVCKRMGRIDPNSGEWLK